MNKVLLLPLIKCEESTLLITALQFFEFFNGRERQVPKTKEKGVTICIPQVNTAYFRIAKTVTFSLNIQNH